MRYTSCTVKLTQLQFLGYIPQLVSCIIPLSQHSSFSGAPKGKCVLFNNNHDMIFFLVNMDKLDLNTTKQHILTPA